jgi:hypothetical protein
LLRFSISELDRVAPDVDLTTKIVEVTLQAKVFLGVMISDPTVVNHLRLLTVIKHAEVRVKKWEVRRDFRFGLLNLIVSHGTSAVLHSISKPLEDGFPPMLIVSVY